jgi:hypothetical protein
MSRRRLEYATEQDQGCLQYNTLGIKDGKRKKGPRYGQGKTGVVPNGQGSVKRWSG